MNVLVVGLGSMGKRRIRLMKQLYREIQIAGIDTNKGRRVDANQLFDVTTYSALQEAVDSAHFDAAFICTAPLGHSELITQCLENGLHVFTEINLVEDGYDLNIKLSAQKGLVLFLSSTPMYRNEIRFITQKAHVALRPVTYNYHVGQYLPDWHPWEDYKQFFVGDKRTNGCREIFGIELPWILEAFGPVKSATTVKSRNSKLNIDYADSYLVLLEHENGNNGVLIVDIVSRTAIRHLEIVSEELHLFWNGTPDSLRLWDIEEKSLDDVNLYESVEHREGYADNIVENAYCDEIKTFFDCIDNRSIPKHTFERDRKILQLIDTIEG